MDKMKLNDQVCNFELAKKLKKLGVKQKSLWYWEKNIIGKHSIIYHGFLTQKDAKKCVSAFTLSELGEMLPKSYSSGYSLKDEHGLFYCWIDLENFHFHYDINADLEVNARAKMLIYLIETNLIERKRK